MAQDSLLPAAIAVLGAVELYGLRSDGWGYGIALECASCLLLIGRRPYTLIGCTLAAVLILAMPLVGPQLDEPATPILILVLAAYSLARRLESLNGLFGMGAIGLMLGFDYALVDQRDHNVSDLIFVVALLMPPYVLGRLTRKLDVQSELLVHQQELLTQDAVNAERNAIARDLHDVIAHSISAMVVQTAAAEDLVRTDPGRAEAVLKEVANTGRRAISETGRLLHLIRDNDDELGLAPTPGLAGLHAMVESFRDSGLVVHLELDEPMSPLPEGLDLSAYRIVQEALTNALKYSADRTASVHLGSTPTLLSIRAENAVSHGNIGGSGLGLVGMAERVSLFGGGLSHQLTKDGRFVLHATIPVGNGGESE